MRHGATILAIIALYGVIAYLLGIPLPPQPWRSYFGLAALEAFLLCYNSPVVERMNGARTVDGYTDEQNALVRSIEVEKTRRVYMTLVMVCSVLGETAVLCCHDGAWIGPQTDIQKFTAIITGMLHGIACLGPSIAISEDRIQPLEAALAESLSPTAPVEPITTSAQPDLEAGLVEKQ
ncbi:hypothetical protein FFLO_03531 [Filobasidium floriforme]|uniref:Uncharacterized protein n=1 Tax=Filobasidium floriforme TaxID=5210 RepID=A0A8K0JML9_9TREE|nr:uncharacterized protein HD553DRAFT_37069 [Filobasidium floriforme]KAG7536011.1 hypothetical protein FFLO_03531 [Filobasidium floriforme]KAH8084842.1 hypothetical protein HD553DRAFT_37069 [Filobasidium floriforme]